MTATGDEATGAPLGDAPASGLRALYAGLTAAAARYDLDALAVAVDDPALGRQMFAAGLRADAALTALADDRDRTWCAIPLRDDIEAEVDVLRSFALTALRLAGIDPDADPTAALEARLRALPEVRSVTRRHALLEVTPHPGGQDALDATLASAGMSAAIVVVRAPVRAGDEHASTRVANERPVLLAVHTLPERGELEVHLRAGDRRTVGRATLSRTAAGAASATLDALDALDDGDPPRRWHVGWVRTIDTTADRAFLVAVSIRREGAGTLYGIAEGTSPVDAAARATLHACNRVVTWHGTDRPTKEANG